MWWNHSTPVEVVPDEDLLSHSETAALVKLSSPERDDEMPASDLSQIPGRSVNSRFFWTAVGAAVLALAAGHGLHAYQMERISRVFFENAETAVAAGESRAAIQYIRQYLNFHPQDLEARVLLAEELAKTAETPRDMLNVLLLSEGILRTDATRSALCARMVKFYLRLGQHRNALVHLTALLHEKPDDTELSLQAAQCHEALGESDKAVAAYRQLIRVIPYDVRVYERLAYLLREGRTQPEAADRLIQDLMDSTQGSALAYAVRAGYRQRYGELKHAARDARIAYQRDPQNADILKLAAAITVAQLKTGEPTDFPISQVRTDLEGLLAKQPGDKATIHALIDLDRADGRSARAEERLRTLLQQNPSDVMSRFQLADLLLADRRLEESTAELKRIRDLGITSPAVDFLEARIRVVQERWLEAIGILERVHLNPRDDPELASSVHQQLGRCYEHIGHNHRRLKAYRDAVQADPHSVEAHLGLASALARLGRIEEALAEYKQLRGHPQVALATARLRLLQHLLLPPAERNWLEVETAIVEAIRKNADSDQTLRLRVIVLTAQDHVEAARRLLEQERNQRPNSRPVWLLSAQLENWAGQPDAAAEILKIAQSRLGKSSELELAQLRLNIRQPHGNRAEVMFGTLEDWNELPEQVRVPALGELADGLEEIAADPPEALGVRLKLAALQPDDLRVWQRVLPLAIAAKNDEAAKRAVEEIRRIEGDAGPYGRLAEADRLMMLARRGNKECDSQAQTLLAKLRNEWPADWTIPLRLARIAERGGKTDQAIVHYKAILNREVYPPQVVKRLVSLLSSKGRDAEADGYLTQLQKTQPKSFGARYGRMAALVALRSAHWVRALELARQAVAANSPNPKDHFWLGQILDVLGLCKQAETALRKSIELAPTQPAARVALIRLLQKSNHQQEARAEILALQKDVPPEQAALPLAYCLELTDQPAAAYQAYQDLLEISPQNGYFRWVFADYCLRSGRREQAETRLRNLLDSPQSWKDTPLPAVRRGLVQLLVQQPEYPSHVEALALLEQNLSADPQSLPDLRRKAHLLAALPFHQDRLRALAVFDQLAELAPLTQDDQIQRVQLLDNLHRQTEAKDAVEKLLSTSENDPKVLGFGIRHLLDWGEGSESLHNRLTRLETQAPGAFSPVELRARLLVAEGKADEALSALNAWKSARSEPPDPEEERNRLEQVVQILMTLTEQQDRLGLARLADVLAAAADRHLAELISLKPERITWKLRFLTGRWQLDEAWRLSEEAWTSAPAADVAAALVPLLQKSREDQRRDQGLRGPLEAALAREPGSLELKTSAAAIAQLCGRMTMPLASTGRLWNRPPAPSPPGTNWPCC